MAEIISLDVTSALRRSPVTRAPHELRCECRDCGAHARVLVAYGIRTGHCSVCGSARLDDVPATSGLMPARRFERTR
jgi:ribosomal protein L37E